MSMPPPKPASTSSQSQNTIDISTLPVSSISQLQSRLASELEHLTSSHARLRSAQAQFRDCIKSIKEGIEAHHPRPEIPVTSRSKSGGGAGKGGSKTTVSSTRPQTATAPETTAGPPEILIPLTTSLYVPGTLASTTLVLVDVGTGFFVEKTTADAKKYYEGKVNELEGSLAGIEKAVGSKSESLRAVEDVLRRKVMEEQQGQGQGQSGEQGG